MGATHLWPQRFGYELTLQEFLWAYRPFALFGEPGFFSLTAGPGKKIIDKVQTSNKGWKTKFFHLSTLRFCKENPKAIAYPPLGRVS